MVFMREDSRGTAITTCTMSKTAMQTSACLNNGSMTFRLRKCTFKYSLPRHDVQIDLLLTPDVQVAALHRTAMAIEVNRLYLCRIYICGKRLLTLNVRH